MFGFQSSPFNGGASQNIQEFFANGSTGFQIWQKPQGYSMAYMLCIGAGASGAGGATGAIGTGRTGGGGGGSGAQARLIIPISLLPDLLFIQVGRGGLGVAANTAGNTGQRSLIQVSSFATSANHNLVLASGAAVATAGAVAGTAGAGEGVFAISSAVYANLGIMLSIAGAGGSAGGAVGGASGANVTQFATSITCGGAGGGSTPVANTNNAGGNITALGLFPAVSGGAAGGGAGNNGYYRFQPHFYTCGGSGGGSNGAAGTGGDGGRGGLGCGGGGGGGGVTGGRGGAGGDGYVCIVCA
jgi:hypothetical protein